MKQTVRIKEKKQHYFTREAYATLRTNLLFSGADVKVIAVTSCTMHEGKSTTSLSLAKSFSDLGKRVLLVDADLRKSVLASQAEGRGGAGLSAYLSGQAEEEEIVCQTQHPTLNIVFAGRVPPNPVELLDSERMRELLTRAKEEYDVVLVDLPPLGMVVDSAVVSPFCDGTIFVLKAGEARAREVAALARDLREKGCVVLGAVLNHIATEKGFRTRTKELFRRLSRNGMKA